MSNCCTVALIFVLLALNTPSLNASNQMCSVLMSSFGSGVKTLNNLVHSQSLMLKTLTRMLHGPVCIPVSCVYPLGMESGAILNSHITASSSWRSSYNGAKARLNRNSVWVVRSNNANHWLQVDLRKVKTVTKVATQGRPHSYSQWVTSYTVSYSTDGRHWIAYTDFGRVKVFQANKDQNTVVYNFFYPPIEARYIRIHPKSWRSHISMRAELYGCE